MAPTIEEDAIEVLRILCEWSEAEDDPAVGNYWVSGPELTDRLGWASGRINNAVEWLYETNYVDWRQVVADSPYKFREAMPTITGKAAAQRGKAGVRVPQRSLAAPTTGKSQPDPQLVFVVHGRNETIRRAVFTFLRAIGLKPIEWAKAIGMTGTAAPYVGQILDAALGKAQAVVVVMTPDDEARLREVFVMGSDPEYERRLTPQARPNVLFEAGLALGRSPDRTILVEVGRLRPFSDVAGRHTIRLDNSVAKRQDLAQRLERAGCAVDVSGTDWHKEGDFELEAGQATETDTRGSAPLGDEPVSLPTEGVLDETEGSILKLILEKDADGRGLTAEQVADGLDIHRERAELYLHRMDRSKYLMGFHSYRGDPSRYALHDSGRAYLVDRGVI